MYAEGETELRDLIIQNLESSGFLNKIKAELRAGVFIAFEEEGSLRTKIPLFNKKFDEFIETSNGKLVVSLVREFLEFFNLNFTLSVFDPETACTSPCLNRTDLCNKLNVKSSDFDGPVLSAFLETELTSIRKNDSLQSHTENHLLPSTAASSFKSLETIREDFPSKEKNRTENILPNDITATALSSTFDIGNSSLEIKPSNVGSNTKQKIPDSTKKSDSGIIDRLLNEHLSFDSNDKEKNVSSLFAEDKSDINIFKGKTNSSSLDLDPFFDEPVPSEKPSYFNLPNESDFDLNNLKNIPQKKSSVNNSLGSDKGVLSSLKDLPSLTARSKEWTFSRELPKTLPSLDAAKSTPHLEKLTNEESKGEISGDDDKKDPEPESNEELSDRQMNSEESIEEEIEEDFSAGLDDLLNSSLSLADDATTDQTTSQISVVSGFEHVETITN